MNMHSSQFRLFLTYFSLAVAIIIFFWSVNNFEVITGWVGWIFGTLSPFIAGFVMAYIFSIPAHAIQRLLDRTKIVPIIRFKRAISVILVYVLFVLLVIISLQLIIPPVINAVVDLAIQLPLYLQQFLHFAEDFLDSLPIYMTLETLTDGEIGSDFNINNLINFINYETIFSYIGTFFGGAGTVLGGAAAGVAVGAAALFNGFLAIVSSIYFLFETEKLSKYLKRLMFAFVSTKVSTVIVDYGHKINQYFKKYIFCLIADCFIMGIIGFLLLHFIIGSPYAIFLGLLLGVMNLIPYFGSIIATVVAILVVWLTQGLAMGLLSTVVLFISQQVDANVIQPRLYGSSLKLSPLLIIVSVSVGGAIGGTIGGTMGGTILGMIVAIPFAKVITNIIDDIIEYRVTSRGIVMPVRGEVGLIEEEKVEEEKVATEEVDKNE
ncbi:MAG: AI-2E family transporter [Defluviitaleaceae bacterium]|nr:AI-2E family transporter [Defluviitaleaceae bacterium]